MSLEKITFFLTIPQNKSNYQNILGLKNLYTCECHLRVNIKNITRGVEFTLTNVTHKQYLWVSKLFFILFLSNQLILQTTYAFLFNFFTQFQHFHLSPIFSRNFSISLFNLSLSSRINQFFTQLKHKFIWKYSQGTRE